MVTTTLFEWDLCSRGAMFLVSSGGYYFSKNEEESDSPVGAVQRAVILVGGRNIGEERCNAE